MTRYLSAYGAALGRLLAAYRSWAAGAVGSLALVALLGVVGTTALSTGDGAAAAPTPPTSAPATPTTTVPAPDPTSPVPTTPPAPATPLDPSDDDYAFLFNDGGSPVGFDPCAPEIRVLYNPAGAPYDAEGDIAASADLLAEGLGRPVTYEGTTDLDADSFSALTLGANPPSEPTVLVTWVARPDELEDADAGVVGQASPVQVGDSIVSSTVALVASANGSLHPGTGPDSWAVVMIHELAHSAGLDHVDDQSEIMHPSVVPGHPAQWGAGDLNGLRQLAGRCTSNLESFSTTSVRIAVPATQPGRR